MSNGWQVHKLGQVLERLNCRDILRGLRRHYMVFHGNELVQVLIESGVAKDEMDALAVGNAFLREFRRLSPRRFTTR